MLQTLLVLLFVVLAIAKLTAFVPILTWLAVCLPLLTYIGVQLYSAICALLLKWLR